MAIGGSQVEILPLDCYYLTTVEEFGRNLNRQFHHT